MRHSRDTASRGRPQCAGTVRQPGKIIDLFGGAGGWAQGLRKLGLTTVGIEKDGWACETARAAGHKCLQADVAELDPTSFGRVWGMVGSPPCQAYSSAGKGLGRADKPLVIACAHELAAGNDSRKAWREGCRDPRSLLTVEPLRYAILLRPRWVALEQVPPVLELWTLFAGLLATHGYYTATGVLSAERYGVPQTRKRAFLVASLDGPVELPAPTHRSYNPRRKQGVPEEEAGLEPWVSMAQALGWTTTDKVGFPRREDTQSNQPDKPGTGGYRERDRRPACKPAPTLTARTRSWTRKPCVEIRRSGDRISEGFDPTNAPAQAVTTRVNRWQAHDVVPRETSERSAEATSSGWPARRPAPTLVTTRRSKDGLLVGRQLPPGESVERGGWAWRNGNQRNASVRASEKPAPTVHFGHRANQVEWVPCAYETRQRGARPRPNSDRCEQRRGANAVRVTVQQAAILQGFPADYPWQGARTRQFEQVGNAVPPPLAHRVLEQAIQPSTLKRRQTDVGKGRR